MPLLRAVEEERQVQAWDEAGEGEAVLSGARVWVVAVPPVESPGACAQWSSCFSWFTSCNYHKRQE